MQIILANFECVLLFTRKRMHKVSVQRTVPFKPWVHLSIRTASAQSYRAVYSGIDPRTVETNRTLLKLTRF